MHRPSHKQPQPSPPTHSHKAQAIKPSRPNTLLQPISPSFKKSQPNKKHTQPTTRPSPSATSPTVVSRRHTSLANSSSPSVNVENFPPLPSHSPNSPRKESFLTVAGVAGFTAGPVTQSPSASDAEMEILEEGFNGRRSPGLRKMTSNFALNESLEKVTSGTSPSLVTATSKMEQRLVHDAPCGQRAPLHSVGPTSQSHSPLGSNLNGDGDNVPHMPSARAIPQKVDNVWTSRKGSAVNIVRTGVPSSGPHVFRKDGVAPRGSPGVKEGKPVISFSSDDVSVLAGRLDHAVVGKFSHSIPSAHLIQKALGNISFVGTFSWKYLNAKHILIEFSELRDYVRFISGPNGMPTWYIEHHPMRVFKWTPEFDPFFESPIVPIWCNLPNLPVFLFEESALLGIGSLFGSPVQADRATITRSRVSYARICVEIDISKPVPESFMLDIAGQERVQKIFWDRIPNYCTDCKHVGHLAENCYAFGKLPKPARRDYSGVGKGVATKAGQSGSAEQPRDSQRVQADPSVSAPSNAETDDEGFRAQRRYRRKSVKKARSGSSGRGGAPSRKGGASSSLHAPGQVSSGVVGPVPGTEGAGPKGKEKVCEEDGESRERQLVVRSSAFILRGSGRDFERSRSLSPVVLELPEGAAFRRRAQEEWRSERKELAETHLALTNAFAALSEDEGDEDDLLAEDESVQAVCGDVGMVEASATRTRLLELVVPCGGMIEEATEGVAKKARVLAPSSSDMVPHV